MPNLPTAEEIAELTQFVWAELESRRAFSTRTPIASARSALAIAEWLPALVAERDRLSTECAMRGKEVMKVYAERDRFSYKLHASMDGSAKHGYIEECRLLSAEVARLTKERDDAIDRADEAADIIRERDDRLSLCDRIANLIGLPHDQELTQVAFDLWFGESRDDIARLTKERDEWKHSATGLCEQTRRDEADLARLTRENAAMREALSLFYDWVDVEQKRITAVERYNTALKDQQERGIFPVRVAGEWEAIGAAEKQQRDALKQAFESAQHNRAALAQLDAPPAEEAPPLTVDYTNWRGERRVRNIIPLRPFFGSNEWHKEPQWLLEAIDPEDGKVKTFAFAGIHGFGEPSEEAESKFDEWIRELDEDVIQGEYGYERGEFTVFPDHWRSAFDEWQSPKQAFDRSLKAYADARKERDRDAKANYELIKAKDRATLAEHALAAARQTIAEAVEVIKDADSTLYAVRDIPPNPATRMLIDNSMTTARAFVDAHGKKEGE